MFGKLVDVEEMNISTSTQKQWDTDPIFTEHWVDVVLQESVEIFLFIQLDLK